MGGYRVFFFGSFCPLHVVCKDASHIFGNSLWKPDPNPQWTPASSGGIFLSRSWWIPGVWHQYHPGSLSSLVEGSRICASAAMVAGWLSPWLGGKFHSNDGSFVVLLRGIWIRSKSWKKQKLTSPTSNSLWTEVWHIIVAQIKAATRKTFCLVCWIRVASAGLSLLEKICYVHLQLSKWAGENSHQMINSIDPDDHSPRLHVIIAMKKNLVSFAMWLPRIRGAHGFPHAPAGPRFELFNILDVAPLAAENADWNFAVGSCLFFFLPPIFLPPDFGFWYWGANVRLFWGWISKRVKYLYDLDWRGSRQCTSSLPGLHEGWRRDSKKQRVPVQVWYVILEWKVSAKSLMYAIVQCVVSQHYAAYVAFILMLCTYHE